MIYSPVAIILIVVKKLSPSSRSISPGRPEAFAQDKFGPLKNCPSGGDWEAILVEAEWLGRRQGTMGMNEYPYSIFGAIKGATKSFPATY